MRIVVPYTTLHPQTIGALARQDFECVYVGRDDEAYWRLLDELWAAGDDFMLVEQDIVIGPATVEGFANCMNPWCAAPYPYLRSERYAGLGCCRFRAAFIRRHPDLMGRVAARHDVQHPQRHWCTLDAWVQRELGSIGNCCIRHNPVGHLHRNPSHGCIPAEYLHVEAAR